MGISSSGMWFIVCVSGKVCEGEARPNQRALVGVYQQMPKSWLLWGRSAGRTHLRRQQRPEHSLRLARSA